MYINSVVFVVFAAAWYTFLCERNESFAPIHVKFMEITLGTCEEQDNNFNE